MTEAVWITAVTPLRCGRKAAAEVWSGIWTNWRAFGKAAYLDVKKAVLEREVGRMGAMTRWLVVMRAWRMWAPTKPVAPVRRTRGAVIVCVCGGGGGLNGVGVRVGVV